jgi:hypothetical protein
MNVVFKATDQATPTIKQIQDGVGGNQGSILSAMKGLINPTTIAMAAITGLGHAVSSAFGDWREYTTDVADFADMIGATTEEASVFQQLMGDFNITMDTMLASMRTLAKQGLDPTIEGLIGVRAQLDATGSASERLALAQKLLGEQGIEQIIPMLNQLTDEELRNYADGMKEGKIVTEEMAQAARDQEMAMAHLGDTIDSVKFKFTTWAAPGFTAFIELLDRPLGADSAAQFINDFFQGTFLETEGSKIERYIDEMGEFDRHFSRIGDSAGDAETAINSLTEAQYLEAAAEALIAGNTALAQYYADLAYQAERNVGLIQRIIRELDNLDGQTITTNLQIISQGGGGGSGPSVDYNPADTGGGGSGGVHGYYSGGVFHPTSTYEQAVAGWRASEGYQTGGSFTVGGGGGADSQRVSFRATPGEVVNISKEDSIENLAAEVRRLVNQLPIIMRDAVTRG